MLIQGKKRDLKKKHHVETTNTDYLNSFADQTILNFSEKEPKTKPFIFHTFYEANIYLASNYIRKAHIDNSSVL